MSDILSVYGLQTLRSNWRRPLVGLTVLLLLCLSGQSTAFAANPPPVQSYYIPLPENQVLDALTAIYPSGSECASPAANVSDPIRSYISISVISDNTILYYDHWEDGFEIDVANPTQASTEIWGDGDLTNGVAPGVASDLIDAGTVIVLDNAVQTGTLQSVVDFDGGDRVASSKLVAMTRAAWATGSSTLLAGAVEVYDTGKWGTVYQAPVGEDVGSNSLFEYTSLLIMAAGDGTNVWIDLDADGTADASTVLNQGQSYHVNGGVQAGTVVTADAPVQVTMITGDVCDSYESRWYVLFPSEQWSDSYYSPVGTPAGDGTTVFLFNRNIAPLTVHWETTGGQQPDISVPAGGTASALVPDNSGAHFFTDDAIPFAAIAAVDSDQGTNFNSKADWGFSLVPERQLTAQILVGWGPGRDPLSSVKLSENGSPVWVMPVLSNGASGPVDICADYDGDDAGPLLDPFGFHYDELLTLNEFESAKVFENGSGNDRDQTGMVLYICDSDPIVLDNATITAAWGQAPGVASADEPGLDLGTTAPPASSFTAGKGAEVVVDADGDGLASPGDTLLYSVVIRNSSHVPIENVTISDTVPIYTSYVADSTTFDNGTGAASIADNDSGTSFPLDEGGIGLGDLPVQGLFTVSFRVVVDDPFPVGVDRVRNVAIVSAGGETVRPEVETPIDLDPALSIQKSTNDVDADDPPGPYVRVDAGVTWTYQIANTGIVTIANLSVTDSVPGVTPVYVSGDSNGDDVLDLDEVWRFTATGTAVAGQYSNVGAVSGIGPDGDVANASDPSHYFGIQPGIDLHKSVDQATVLAGTTVTYTFAVSNTGNVPLSNLAVEDDRCAPLVPEATGGFNTGDGNQDNLLDPGEIWTFTCATVIGEDVTNVGSATALDPLGQPVTASDTASVVAIAPGLHIEKEGSDDAVLPGTTVTYTYTVTNSGDVALADVAIEDDRCAPLAFLGGDTNGDERLDLEEAWRYRCAAAIQEDTTNTATVTARDPLGNLLSDQDTFSVVIPIIYLPIVVSPPEPCPPPDGCPIEGLEHAKGLAVHEGENRLYITSRDNNQLLVVDPLNNEVVDQAPTGAEPWSIAVNETSGRIYVSNYASGDVWVYAVDTLDVLAKIPVGNHPALMTILPDLDTVFVVVRENSRIAIIQGLSLAQETNSGGSAPYGIAADPVNQRIFVSNRDSGHLAALVQQDGSWLVQRGPLLADGRTLFDLAYAPASNKLYLVYGDAGEQWFVDVWKPDTAGPWALLGTIPVDSGGALSSPDVGGTGLAVNPNTGNVFNVNTGAATLSVIDGERDRLVDTIVLGEDPFPIAINAKTNTVFVGLRRSGRIIKIEDSYR